MSPSPTESNKELVWRYFDAINDGDQTDLRALQADDVVYHSTGSDVQGIDAVVERAEAQRAAIPDLTETLDMLFAEEDMVAVRTTATGTNEGEVFGIEPTGEKIEVVSMQVARFEDGNIAEWWNHPNRLGLLEQIGVLDAPLE